MFIDHRPYAPLRLLNGQADFSFRGVDDVCINPPLFNEQVRIIIVQEVSVDHTSRIWVLTAWRVC
jgi:hypothetical protein